jgi:hypothetical protein
VSKNVRIILSTEEKQNLDGCLLGDGFLAKRDHNSSHFQYVSSQFDHVKYVWTLFNRITTPKFKGNPAYYKVFNKRTQKFYVEYRFATQSNITFYELREKWYPQGKKVVPVDLVLTPATCLLWYIGDGSLCKTAQHITLYTNGFNVEDVDFLTKKLNELDFESFKILDNQQYGIRIPRRKVQKFLNYIGPCVVKCYSYKWNYRNYIHIEDRKIHRKKVLQLDLNGNTLKMWSSACQVQRELGYYQAHISRCCLGKATTAYGYKWQYV